MSIDELLSEMKKNPVSLFYGAGVTLTCGGPDWDQLFSSIKTQFPEGTSNDFFAYMEEIIGFDNINRAEIEHFIRSRLASISAKDDQKYLFSIPWRAVLTTNYDSLPESIDKTIDHRRQIVSVADPTEHIEQMREDHLYCFKLLGDYNYSFSQGGWMVLSTSDLFAAAERRTRFFQQFRNLATTGHIVYIGYSFKDDLIFLLLNQMKTILGHFPWKGFAVTPSEPAPRILKKLESIGIEWVKGTLEEFVSAAKKVFGEQPQSTPVDVGFVTIHRHTIELDRSILSNIWNKFSILHDGLMLPSSETAIDFLRGISRTFHPYVFNWDYPRKTRMLWRNPATSSSSVPAQLSGFKERTAVEDLKENTFVALVGIAGSGKTIAVNRLAFDWHQSGNPVVFVNSVTSSLDMEALDGAMNEIRDKYLTKAARASVQNPSPIRWLIIADDCASLLSELRMLRNHLLSTARPADLILVARETETPVEKLKNLGLDAIYRLNDSIDLTEIESFLGHFKRFGVMDEDTVLKNLQDREINSSFFGLIYSSIHHAQKTIRRLLEEEYTKLDSDSKRIYRIASLVQSYRLKPLISLILRSESADPTWLSAQVKKGSLGGVVQLLDYERSLSTPNRFVAEAISAVAFRTSEERKLALGKIISAVTFGDSSEMEFLQNLLNESIEEDIGPRLTKEHKIELFRRGIERVKSRPLLIHLGRIETNAQKFPEARKTLREAYLAHVDGFDERAEHVRDAEGRLEFAMAEADIILGEIDSAWEHLQQAEERFVEAKINPGITPHPYEGMGRTYLAKARIAKEKGLQWNFVLAAMQECNYVERYLGETSGIFVLKKEVENMLDSLGFDESHIEEIADRVGKANGYAYLAENEISKGHYKEALACVEKGLKFEAMSVWLMRLRVSLLRRLSPDAHSEIAKTLDDYYAISNERYDVELSFELAKETYVEGRIGEARRMFSSLFTNTHQHPRRLIPRDIEDRWIEEGKPKRLSGTIMKIPTENRYGLVQTTFPSTLKDRVAVRRRDLQFKDVKIGDRVTYEVVFNMLGPEASRVRKL